MSTDLQLTRQLLQIFCDQKYTERRLVLMKDMPQYGTPFITSKQEQILEIVLFKSTWIQVFKECHTIFDDFLSNEQLIPDELSLEKMYFATAGLMLTTNENHTAINVHEDIVLKILGNSDLELSDPLLHYQRIFINELYFLQALLNSNVDKLNKSSSYWHLLKKLFTHAIATSSLDKLPENFFLRTTLVSAKLHFSNYYAWNFLRYCINVFKLHGYSTALKEIYNEVDEFCKMNRNDASSWSCYTDLVEINIPAIKQACSEFNKRVSKPLTFTYSSIALTSLSVQTELLRLDKWLWDSKCTAEVPYKAFGKLLMYAVRVANDGPFVRQMMEQVVVHCSLMEQVWFRNKGIDIVVKKGYFKTNVDLEKDLVLRDEVQTYSNWKRLLNWHVEMIFDRYDFQNMVV